MSKNTPRDRNGLFFFQGPDRFIIAVKQSCRIGIRFTYLIMIPFLKFQFSPTLKLQNGQKVHIYAPTMPR